MVFRSEKSNKCVSARVTPDSLDGSFRSADHFKFFFLSGKFILGLATINDTALPKEFQWLCFCEFPVKLWPYWRPHFSPVGLALAFFKRSQLAVRERKYTFLHCMYTFHTAENWNPVKEKDGWKSNFLREGMTFVLEHLTQNLRLDQSSANIWM